MNYLRIINNFWEVADEKELSANDKILFFAILRFCNALRWINPFIMDWVVVMQYSGISKNTYYKSLQKLNDTGFISYEKGKKNVTASKITILNFENSTKNSTENSINNSIANSSGNSTENSIGNLSKQLNIKTKETLKLKELNSELEKQVLELRAKNEALILEVEKKKAKPPKKSKKEFPTEIVDFTREMIAYLKPEYSEGMSENTFWSNCDTIDKLIRLDKETMENIRYVMNWISNDDFWSVTLQGINKLREKNKQGVMRMVDLKARIKAEKNKPQPTNQGYQTANERRQQKSKEVGEQLMQQLINNANGGK